ncbi:MAG: tetratricopeptide repeat protein [Campylobacterota bacterium]|nr:tetratricopeptide repeat protein [Campylobacterota bacterium]
MAVDHYNAGMNFYESGKHVEALGHLLQGSEAEDPRCDYALAVMYYNGQGVVRDYAESTRYYTQAADAGILPALVSAGFAYANAIGVAEDFDKAVHYLRQAVEMGDDAAKVTLAEIYAKGYEDGSIQEAAKMIKEVLLKGSNEEAMDVYSRYSLGNVRI